MYSLHPWAWGLSEKANRTREGLPRGILVLKKSLLPKGALPKLQQHSPKPVCEASPPGRYPGVNLSG